MATDRGLRSPLAEAVADYGRAAAGYAHSGEGTPMDRMHAATGIQEEAIELHEVVEAIWDSGGNFSGAVRNQLKAELGGVMWYINYTAHVFGHTLSDVAAAYDGIPLPEVAPGSTRHQSTKMLLAARHIASQIKKHTYHGAAMPDTKPLLRSLYMLWTHISLLALPYRVTIRDAMAYNLTELQARHGGQRFNPAVYTGEVSSESHARGREAFDPDSGETIPPVDPLAGVPSGPEGDSPGKGDPPAAESGEAPEAP